MCPAHRRQDLDEIKRRLLTKRPVLVISTQLIEAGVDISFGAVIRFLAGLDSIAQAAGRCNRNGESDLGLVHVINSRDEILGPALIDIEKGQEGAARILDEHRTSPTAFDDDPIGPKAMTRYYEYMLYAQRREMSYPLGSRALGHDDTLLNLLSANTVAAHSFRRKGESADFLCQSFQAAGRLFRAFDAPSDGVIVPFGPEGEDLITALCATDNIADLHALLSKAQPYSVSVFPSTLDRMVDAGAVRPIGGRTQVYVCESSYYRQDIGLNDEPIANGEG
jgi:CRISPR-associated endonuclease/helicase Cas3